MLWENDFLFCEKPVATITIICNQQNKEAVVHVVACKPQRQGYRGFTYSNSTLGSKKEGMKTATLDTDDFRIPAIKTYLRVGFKPVLSTDDYKKRWEKIMQEIK